MTFSVSKLSSMENPVLFSYKDGKLKKMKAEINSKADTISTKAKTDGMYLIVNVPVPLTGLSMESQIQITKGNSKTLTPEKVPADATSKVNYVWKSSDSSVVSVDSSGVITAKKKVQPL
ncbi:Ig-like domain-containing protein [Blautia sp. RD014234]|nr:Ig-like domain-containing protein [Blautia parvula]